MFRSIRSFAWNFLGGRKPLGLLASMAVLCVGSVAVVTAHATVAHATAPRASVTPRGPGSAAKAAGADGVAAGNAAIASVDLAGTWSFTPGGPGGDVDHACPVAAGTSRASPT